MQYCDTMDRFTGTTTVLQTVPSCRLAVVHVSVFVFCHRANEFASCPPVGFRSTSFCARRVYHVLFTRAVPPDAQACPEHQLARTPDTDAGHLHGDDGSHGAPMGDRDRGRDQLLDRQLRSGIYRR